MRRDDRASGLRFEPKGGEPTGATSGQHGPKFRQDKAQDTPAAGQSATAGKRRQPDLRPDHLKEPGAAPPPDAPTTPASGPSSRLRFEDAPPKDGPGPPGDTSGQVGPKSAKGEKLRQDSEKARPSERLRHEDAAPGGEGGKAGPQGKRGKAERKMDKSKLRMEKTGAKLDKATDKLARQKPQKRPGPIKTVGREATGRAWGYVHKKIHQVEHENVGVEGAHKSELVAEGGIRGGTRFIKKRIRTRPARQVRKLRRKSVKATADFELRKLAQEHPHLTSNPLSRMWQKRKLKKKYAKEARELAKKGAKAAKKTAVTTEKIAAKIARALFLFVKRHPVVTLVIILLLLLLMVVSSIISSLGMVGSGIAGAAGGTSYLAEDGDIDQAELAYTEWETDLYLEAMNAESSHPGYDEYRCATRSHTNTIPQE